LPVGVFSGRHLLKPIFVGIRYASRAIGRWTGSVEKHLGPADAILRFGSRDQKAWFEKRIDNILPHSKTPIILYGRVEARRFVGISTRAAQRILPDELGVAWFIGFAGLNHPLFTIDQLIHCRKSIASGSIRVQRRSLKAPRFLAYTCPARHTISEDVAIETERITKLRFEPSFWSKVA
jgi:hypothetical protein